PKRRIHKYLFRVFQSRSVWSSAFRRRDEHSPRALRTSHTSPTKGGTPCAWRFEHTRYVGILPVVKSPRSDLLARSPIGLAKPCAQVLAVLVNFCKGIGNVIHIVARSEKEPL